MPPVQRPRYFDHQFLKVEDFTLETEYHLDMRRRHNNHLHTPGVADGLTVSGSSGATSVTVAPGVALDTQGREIVLIDPRTLTLPSGVASAQVYIVYDEEETDQVTAAGVSGNRRFAEDPAVVLSPPAAVPPDGIRLAALALNNGQLTAPPNNTVRQPAASVVMDDLPLRSLVLRQDSLPSLQWPRLLCTAANLASLENASLRLDSGREIFFQDNGQIRSLDQNHRLVFNRANNRLELHELGDILFLTGGPTPTEKLRIQASGNVGVGTAAPENAEGWSRVVDILGGPHTKLSVRTAGVDARVQSHDSGFWGAPPGMILGTRTAHAVSLGTNAASRLTIDAAGNVGIGTVSPAARLQVEGSIRSPMWRVSQVFRNVPGNQSLVNRQFTTGGGVLLVLCSGSGFSNAGARVIGADVRIDDVTVSELRSFTNEVGSHKAFVANPELVGGIAAGTHRLSIVPIAGTSVDLNDFFNASVIEFPWTQSEFVFVPVAIGTVLTPGLVDAGVLKIK